MGCDLSYAMIFHKRKQGSLPCFFLVASFCRWKGCVISLFSCQLTGSLCSSVHLWLLLNLSMNYCLPRQSACLSLVLYKLLFSYLLVGVTGLWPGKAGLHNSNPSLSLFTTFQFAFSTDFASRSFMPLSSSLINKLNCRKMTPTLWHPC